MMIVTATLILGNRDGNGWAEGEGGALHDPTSTTAARTLSNIASTWSRDAGIGDGRKRQHAVQRVSCRVQVRGRARRSLW